MSGVSARQGQAWKCDHWQFLKDRLLTMCRSLEITLQGVLESTLFNALGIQPCAIQSLDMQLTKKATSSTRKPGQLSPSNPGSMKRLCRQQFMCKAGLSETRAGTVHNDDTEKRGQHKTLTRDARMLGQDSAVL